jgi:outer membrane protein TolC
MVGLRLGAFLLVWVGLAGVEARAEAPHPELTFVEAWDRLKATHPRLSAFADVDMAFRQSAQQAKAYPNPHVSLAAEDVGFSRDPLGTTQWTMSFSQPIPLGSRLEAARRVQEKARIAWSHDADQEVMELRAYLKALFVRGLAIQRRLEVLRRSGDRYRELAQVTRARVVAGALPRVQLQRVEQILTLGR